MAPDPDNPASDPSDGLASRPSGADREAAPRDGDPSIGLDDLTDAELEAAHLARSKARRRRRKSPTRNAIEWVVVVGGAILVAIVIRTFVFQTFWIPSASMSSTLVENDRVLVNKLAYRTHDVRRGDVIVFERPPNMAPSKIKDLIKRVVAVPGDRVSVAEGKVLIDGKPLDEPYTHGQPTEPCAGGEPALATEAGLEIPDGKVLVMGDNRGDSEDGRCFGPIDQDLIVGRAFAILWPPSKMGGL